MNIVCVICSDLLVPSDDVFHTPCGHIFHFVCLSQWLERSKSCPQCREKTTANKIHRIYFNFSNNETITEDACSLQDRIDKLNFQLLLRDKDIKHYTEKNETLETQNAGLRKEVRKVESELNEKNSAIHALKDQMKYLKNECSEINSLKQEIERLKRRLEDCRNIQILLDAPAEDVDEMVSAQWSDPTALITYISVMKREMTLSLAKRRELRAKVKALQQELTKVSMERNFLSDEHTRRKKLEEDLIICESEKLALQNKLQEIERNGVTKKKCKNDDLPKEQNANNTERNVFKKSNIGNINDLGIEQQNQMENDKSKKDNQYFPEKEKTDIKPSTVTKTDENSPYLPVKSQGTFGLKEHPLQKRPTVKLGLSILAKKSRLERMGKSFVQNNMLTYDGFGGHSKYEKFPIPFIGCKKMNKEDGRKTKKPKLDTGNNQKLAEFIGLTQ